MEERNLNVKLNLSASFGDIDSASEALRGLSSDLGGLSGKSAIVDGLAASILGLGAALDRLNAGKLSDLGKAISGLGTAKTGAAQAAHGMAGGLDAAGAASKRASDEVKGFAESAKGVGAAAASTRKVNEEIQKVAPAANKAKKAMNDWAQEARTLGNISLNRFLNDMDLVESKAQAIQRRFREMNSELGRSMLTQIGMTPTPIQYALPNRLGNPRMSGYSGPVTNDPGPSIGQDIRAMKYREALNTPISASYRAHSAYDNVLGTAAARVALNPGRTTDAEAAAMERATAAAQRAAEALDRLAAAAAGDRVRYRSDGSATPVRGFTNGNITPSDTINLGPEDYRENDGTTSAGRFSDFLGGARRTGTRKGKPFVDADWTSGGTGILPYGSGADSDIPPLWSYGSEAAVKAEKARMSMAEFGKAGVKYGDHMQSVGFAGLTNAAMIGRVASPVVQTAMTNQQLMSQNELAIRAAGGSKETAAYFSEDAKNAPGKIGAGSLSDALNAQFHYLSSIPSQNADLNNKDWQEALSKGFETINKLSVAAGSPLSPLSSKDSALGVNQAVANLGFDTSTPQKFLEATQTMADTIVKFKDESRGTASDFLGALRTIGPVAAQTHQNPEDLIGLLNALAQQGIVGTNAGNSLKRLTQRETLPAARTEKLIDVISKISHGKDSVSLYDSNGKSRSILDVLGQVDKVFTKYHLSDKDRAGVTGQLSGLYANAPIASALGTIHKAGGIDAIRAKGADIMHGGIAGAPKGERATDSEYNAKKDNIGTTTTKIKGDLDKEALNLFVSMAPKINELLKAVDGLVEGFSKLPEPVKEFAVAGLAATVATSALFGVMGVLGGNLLKGASGMIEFAGDTGRMIGMVGKSTEELKKMDGAMPIVARGIKAVGSSFSAFGSTVASIGPTISSAFAGIGISADLTWAEILGPITLVVAAVAAVGIAAVDLWHAWQVNAGNIQGAWHGLVNDAKIVWGSITSFVQQTAQGIKWAIDDVLNILGGLGTAFDSILDKAGKFVQSMSKLSGIKLSATGQAAVNFAKFTGESFSALGNQFHGSPSTTHRDHGAPTSALIKNFNPTSDGTGASPADQAAMHKGIEDVLGTGAPKAKKVKAIHIPVDVVLDVGNVNIEQLEREARRLEAEWKKKGEKHKNEYIDVHDKQGNTVGREYGVRDAWAQASRNLTNSDSGLKQKAENLVAMSKFKESTEGIKQVRKTMEAEISGLEGFLKQAKTAGVSDWLETTIAALNKGRDEILSKATEGAAREHARQFGDNGSAATPTGGFMGRSADLGDSFNATLDDTKKSLAEQRMGLKDASDSVETLKSKYNDLYKEVSDLTSEHKKLSDEATAWAASIAATQTHRDSITGTDATSQHTKSALSDEITSEQAKLATVNAELNTQNTLIDQQTIAMNNAGVALNKYIAGINSISQAWTTAQKAALAATTTEQTSIVNSALTSAYTRMTSPSGRKGGGANNPFNELANAHNTALIGGMSGSLASLFSNVAKPPGNTAQVITDAKLDPIAPTLNAAAMATISSAPTLTTTTSQMAQQIASLNSSAQAQTTHMATVAANTTAATQALSTGNATANSNLEQNTTNAKNTSVLPTVTSGGALKVQGSSTTAPTGTAGGSLVKNTASSGSQSEVTQQLDKTLGIQQATTAPQMISAISQVVSGIQTGGLSGALSAGEGALSATGNPYVGAAAAILGAIGIGSKATPATSPDIYDTQQFGTYEADLLGAGYNNKSQVNANGTSFIEDQNTATSTNNLGMIQYIQQWAAANLNNTDASVAQQAKTDVSEFGAYNPNATSAQQILNYDKNIGDESVVGGSLSGSFTDIYNAAGTAVTSIQQLAGAALTAAQNAQTLANSFTSQIFGGPSGFSVPYLGSTGVGNASSSFLGNNVGLQSIGSGSVGNSNPLATTQTVQVNILQGATVQGTSDVTAAITNNLQTITNAVNAANYNTSRYFQNYQSQLS